MRSFPPAEPRGMLLAGRTCSSFKTAWWSLFGGEYETSPVSALYVFECRRGGTDARL